MSRITDIYVTTSININIQEFHIYDSSHTYIHILWIPYIQTSGTGTTVCEISHRSYKKYTISYTLQSWLLKFKLTTLLAMPAAKVENMRRIKICYCINIKIYMNDDCSEGSFTNWRRNLENYDKHEIKTNLIADTSRYDCRHLLSSLH
jgi:hypothetical protein